MAEWQSGRVADWQSSRGSLARQSSRGSLARQIFQGQVDSCFSFPLLFLSSFTCLWNSHLYPARTAISFFFPHPTKSLIHFAPELRRIGGESFGRQVVCSGSPATIRGMLVGDSLTGNPLVAAGLQLPGLQSDDFRPPTPCTHTCNGADSQLFNLSLRKRFFIPDYWLNIG